LNTSKGILPEENTDNNPKITSSTHWSLGYPNRQETKEMTFLDISRNMALEYGGLVLGNSKFSGIKDSKI